MIIYTTIPLELVFEGFDQYQPKFEEIEYQGVKLMIEPQGPYQAKIVRLLSSNPRDYLNPRYSPGNTIYFR
jgi:hypothetical protein